MSTTQSIRLYTGTARIAAVRGLVWARFARHAEDAADKAACSESAAKAFHCAHVLHDHRSGARKAAR